MSKPATLLCRAAYCVAVLICVAACAAQEARAQAQAQPTPRQTPEQTPERRDAPPAAQSPLPSPAASPNVATDATGEPDLSITANVTARELLFEVVPTPKVEFPGRPRRDNVWEAERTNLPPQVQPGVTYRDIGIRLKITSVFADIERIVAEALGEIPASDGNAPPNTDSNENSQTPNGNAPATATTTNETAQPADALPSISLTQTSPRAPLAQPSSPASLKQTSSSASLKQTSPHASLTQPLNASSSQTRRARVRSGGAGAARRERP